MKNAPALRVGVIGLGKVGLPLAAVLSRHGRHSVVGWDIRPDIEDWIQVDHNHPEPELRGLLEGPMRGVPIAPSLDKLVEFCDTIFIVVPTPHPPEYDGSRPGVQHRRPIDFDYSAINAVLDQLVPAIAQVAPARKTVVLVSTVSPGTTRALIGVKPPPNLDWAYNPVFISLGTVATDLLNPKLVLIGADTPAVADQIEQIWRPVINTRPVIRISPESAEVGKLALNVLRSLEIGFINELALLCDALGAPADVDSVREVLQAGRWHYLPSAGLGDGGACRPRDTIVLEAAQIHHGLPSMAATLTVGRQAHAHRLAEEIGQLAVDSDLPITILGTAYKPGVPYQDGSPALLLANLLTRRGHKPNLWDPSTADGWGDTGPQVFVIGVNDTRIHREFYRNGFPTGSIVYDPWGCYDPGSPALVNNPAIVTPGRAP